MSERPCSIEGCNKTRVAQGRCPAHYAAARKSGEIQKLDQSRLHFLSNVDQQARTGICSVCGEVPAWRSGSRWICGKKGRERAAKRRQREEVIRYHKEYAKRNSLKAKLARYQLTIEQWEDLLAECDSRCSICGKELLTPGEQYVDHDHSCCGGGGSCGKCVRAILCRSCNFGIANFSDKPELVRRAAGYLERFAS